MEIYESDEEKESNNEDKIENIIIKEHKSSSRKESKDEKDKISTDKRKKSTERSPIKKIDKEEIIKTENKEAEKEDDIEVIDNKSEKNDQHDLAETNNIINNVKYEEKSLKIVRINQDNDNAQKEEKDEEEGRIKYFFMLISDIAYSYIISMIPPLCDAFEMLNPMPPQNRNQENNEPNPEPMQIQDNHSEIEEESKNVEVEQKLNDELRKDYTNKLSEVMSLNHTHEDSQSKEKPIEKILKRSINTDIDDTNDQGNTIKPKETKHEKILLKSASDTRRVNVDTQSKKFNIFPDETKTEGEYEFSENAMIDNISYNNECLLEQQKKKKTDDHEKQD